jgi:thioredoxin 1
MTDTANSSNYDTKVLGSELPVLVKFGATWCGPCGVMNPILDELSVDVADRLKIINIDVDESGDVSNSLNIASVPTFIVFKNGQELARRAGSLPKATLLTWVGEALTEA